MQHKFSKKNNKCLTGFTLLELMITVAVIGILAAIAYPSYTDYVTRAKRADAKTALLQAQLAQEKWRANNTTYSNSLSDIGVSTSSPDGHYTIAISGTPDATTFNVTATPSGFTDSDCGVFEVDENGKTTSTTQTTTAIVKNCWGK